MEHHVVETERRLSRDSLTGVASREFLEAWLQERAEHDADSACTLIFLDIDDFKHINDRLGHGAGDAVLTRLAGTIAARLPVGAVLARVGGDEFVAALPEDGDGAAVCAGLHKDLAATDLPTVSMGTSTARAGLWREALTIADAQMYMEKAAHHRPDAPRILSTS